MNKLLLLILLLALVLRAFDIGSFTQGVYLDEASIGYDAYSLGTTGADQYGKTWPIYFRSFATYQAPLYIYLSVLPIKILGLTPIGIRIVSLVSGMLTLIVFYFLLKIIAPQKENYFALLGTLVLAISPWHILFSRNALEANLGLCIFISSLYLLIKSIYEKKGLLFLLGMFLLALTNYAYHAYRFDSLGTLFLMAIFFKNKLFAVIKWFLLGLFLFVLILIPQVLIFDTPGSLRRIQSTQYTSEANFKQNGGEFRDKSLGHIFFISEIFLSKYFDYLSPRSIFSDSDPAETKSVVELSSFYFWMFIFLLVGIWIILTKIRDKKLFFLLSIGLISILPAAITTDNLYFLRVLPYLLAVVIIITFGLSYAVTKVNSNINRLLIIFLLTVFSLSNFYINYFVLTKNERKNSYSEGFDKVFLYSFENRNSHFIADLKEPYTYIIALYNYKYNPSKFQQDINLNIKNYYSDLNINENYKIDNLEIRKIDWQIDIYKNQYLIGDETTIPDFKAQENRLTLIKKYISGIDQDYIVIYATNRERKCELLYGPNWQTNPTIRPGCK